MSGYEEKMEAGADAVAEAAQEMSRSGNFDEDIADRILDGDFDDTIADMLGNKKIVRCPFCGRAWGYNGNAKHYGTCPDCKQKVRLHPYLKRGYKPLSPLVYPNRNYKMKRGV